jgi:hypothetical protein
LYNFFFRSSHWSFPFEIKYQCLPRHLVLLYPFFLHDQNVILITLIKQFGTPTPYSRISLPSISVLSLNIFSAFHIHFLYFAPVSPWRVHVLALNVTVDLKCTIDCGFHRFGIPLRLIHKAIISPVVLLCVWNFVWHTEGWTYLEVLKKRVLRNVLIHGSKTDEVL